LQAKSRILLGREDGNSSKRQVFYGGKIPPIHRGKGWTSNRDGLLPKGRDIMGDGELE